MISTYPHRRGTGRNPLDTAETYGPFKNEALVGEALEPLRKDVVIATKFGHNIDLATGERLGRSTAGPSNIKAATEGLLKRLRTDHIDLLYQHRVDPSVADRGCCGRGERSYRPRQGCGYFGLSDAGARSIRLAHAVQPLSALQSEYSLWTREPDAEILPTLEELRIGLVPFSPLGKGFRTIGADATFAGSDLRGRIPRFEPIALKANLGAGSISSAGLRHARVLRRPRWRLLGCLPGSRGLFPIPGTTKPSRLEQNLGAASLQLATDDLHEIEDATTAIKVQGARYPEELMKMTGL